MGKVEALLARMEGQRVYFDANYLIYFFDRREPFFKRVTPFFIACDAGKIFGFTGDAAVAELMFYPYKTKNETEIARGKAFFARENFLSVQSHNADIFDLAAQLGARRGMKLIDALHFATALKAGCSFFLTNDSGIKSDPHLEIVPIKALI
jgi:predicted nucleic acid-binding protein